MKRSSYARPAGNPRRRVSDVVIESLKQEVAWKERLGLGLSTFYLLLWAATLFLWAKYPWLLAGLAHLKERVCN